MKGFCTYCGKITRTSQRLETIDIENYKIYLWNKYCNDCKNDISGLAEIGTNYFSISNMIKYKRSKEYGNQKRN